MRPEAFRDAVTGAARRRRPLTAFGELLRWAGRRRGGLGGGRASPAVASWCRQAGMWAASPPGPDRVHRLGPESSRPRALAFRACATRRS